MIKVIATDLDGTLFYPKKKVRLLSTKNKEFLNRFIDQGNHLILVSGRNYDISEKISKILKRPVTMIGCNGGFTSIDGKKVDEKGVPHEYVEKIIKENYYNKDIYAWLLMTNKNSLVIVLNPHVGFFVRTLMAIGMRFQGAYREKYILGMSHLKRLLKDDKCYFYKIMPYFGYRKNGPVNARKYLDIFKVKYGDSVEVLWSNDALEIMKKGVDKAYALKNLLNVLKLNETETAVIGDSGNDISLFQNFENSFVMFHAPDEVKKEAKHVINGVYEIEKFLNIEGKELK